MEIKGFKNSFMKPQIVHGKWINVDTNYGTTSLYLRDVFHLGAPANLGWDDVKDYVEGDELFGEIEIQEGFGARLSASGYSDCTEWTVFETEKEAVEFLEETYGDEGEV